MQNTLTAVAQGHPTLKQRPFTSYSLIHYSVVLLYVHLADNNPFRQIILKVCSFLLFLKFILNELLERITFKFVKSLNSLQIQKLNRQFFGFINIKYQMSQDYRLKLSKMEEKKKNKEGIQILKGQKMINSVTYRIELQNHTIGDLLRIYLLKNKQVKFAGYKVPHPLDDILEIKVQTTTQDTNKVVKDTLQSLEKELFEMENQFDRVLYEKQKRGA